MSEEFDENEVEFYKSVWADVIPWNDKNYDKKLDETARACLRTEKDTEFIAMCEEHDRMIEEEEKQNALICELMTTSDIIAHHTDSKQDRVKKLKDIVQKIMPEKMESYFHVSEDMFNDFLGRFDADDVSNSLLSCMKYDLIRYIANI